MLTYLVLTPMYTKYFVSNAEVHAYNTSASTDLHVLGPIGLLMY